MKNAIYENLRFAFNNSENSERFIPFHIIGTNSALRRNVLQNQTSVTLASAERIEVLIRFDLADLPCGSKVYFVQGDRSGDHYKLL
jgi:hypothetical protein